MLTFESNRTPVLPVDAATVIFVREREPSGLELFFVRRNASTPFLGGAVVFPGGKLSPRDREPVRTTGIRPVPCGPEGFADDPDHALALALCACRESLEEGRILPTTAPVPPAFLAEVAGHLERGATFAEALAALPEGARVDTASLVPFARWVTPAAEARRFDARFFLAPAPRDQEGEADRHEVVAAVWAPPMRMLDAFRDGAVFLAPPTLRALELLADAETLEDAIRVARAQPLRPIRPTFVPGELPMLVLPGDPLHDERTRAVEGGTRFVLRDGKFVSEQAPSTKA